MEPETKISQSDLKPSLSDESAQILSVTYPATSAYLRTWVTKGDLDQTMSLIVIGIGILRVYFVVALFTGELYTDSRR